MNDAFSSARKLTAAAMSSGVPRRPSGVSCASWGSTSGGSAFSISVLMTPGATQLTRMPVGASSDARERVSAISAPLVAEYVTSQLAPRRPQMDDTLTMHPACSWSIWGSTACMVWNAPSTFTAKYRRHRASVISWNSACPATPALFTSSDTGPSSPSTRRTISFTCTRCATSACTAMARPPAALISATSDMAQSCRSR